LCERFLPGLIGFHIEEDQEGVKAIFIIMDLAKEDATHWKPAGDRVISTLAMAIQMASGVYCVHKAKYVHRDIKPANYLVSANNAVWLSDFGIIARMNDTEELEWVAGSPYFMPLEQSARESKLAFDIFSLGVTFSDLSVDTINVNLRNLVQKKMMADAYKTRPTIEAVLTTLVNEMFASVDAMLAPYQSLEQQAKDAIETAKNTIVAHTALIGRADAKRREVENGGFMRALKNFRYGGRERTLRHYATKKVKAHGLIGVSNDEVEAGRLRLERYASIKEVVDQILVLRQTILDSLLFRFRQSQTSPEKILDHIMRGKDILME